MHATTAGSTAGTDLQRIAMRASQMSEAEAADILTWTDEPELLADPEDPIPVFSATDIAAARLVSESVAAELSGIRH